MSATFPAVFFAPPSRLFFFVLAGRFLLPTSHEPKRGVTIAWKSQTHTGSHISVELHRCGTTIIRVTITWKYTSVALQYQGTCDWKYISMPLLYQLCMEITNRNGELQQRKTHEPQTI